MAEINSGARGRHNPQLAESAACLEVGVAISILKAAFKSVGADEGTLWLLNSKEDALLPVWNSGPNAETFVGSYQQPLHCGLISLVCVAEQALCENRVYLHAGQDRSLDHFLGMKTCSMLAVPVRSEGRVCGVVSCVRLKPAGVESPDPPDFDSKDLARIAEAAESLAPVTVREPGQT